MFIGELVSGCIHIHSPKARETGVEQPLLHGCELDPPVGGILVGVAGDLHRISSLLDGIDADSCHFHKFNKYL